MRIVITKEMLDWVKPNEQAYIEHMEKYIAEAELEQPLPAKEEVLGSNPKSDTEQK